MSNTINAIMYILSAAFFVFITKKCFLDKLSVPKALLLALLSPAAGQFVTEFATAGMVSNVFITKGVMLKAATCIVLIQLIIQLVCLWLYMKVVKSNTPGIAVFVYLCSVQILPGMAYLDMASIGMFPIIAVYIGLHVMFYYLSVVPLSEFKGSKQFTDTKLISILPIITYIFNVAMTFRLFFIMVFDDNIIREFIRIDRKVLLQGSDKVHFDNLLSYINESTYNSLKIAMYPGAFVIAVLIIAFYVITRNIKYMNNAIEAHKEVKALSVEVMEALAHTIDAKDEYTRGHSTRVAMYSRMIAEKMGLSDTQCENIYYMGLLHDIGKIGVPNEIINKPSRLTDEEYEVIKTHPSTGYDILAEIKSRPDLATGARWHHEKYDGTGYPDHKAGEDIPLEARIIAVADSYDAMTSNRSYRDYMPQAKVRDEIEKNIGTQFDEASAKCMLAIIDEDKDYVLHE